MLPSIGKMRTPLRPRQGKCFLMSSNALAHAYFNIFSNTKGSKVSAYHMRAVIIASAYRMWLSF